jgi:hypothetical protein
MDERIAALKARIENVDRGRDGRRIFTAPIRRDVIALAKAWDAEERNRASLAKALGLHEKTLMEWLGPKHGPAKRQNEHRVRRVEVQQVEPATSSPTVLVLVFASGVRIENATIEDAVALVRALR